MMSGYTSVKRKTYQNEYEIDSDNYYTKDELRKMNAETAALRL